MTDYFVDPLAAGANDGSSWSNAWTDIQSAFDTVTAGNTIKCRGEQFLTAQIDIDTQEGSEDGGFIHIVGCNAQGENDGTRFVLNGQNTVLYNMLLTGKDFYLLENIESKNAVNDGFCCNSTSYHWAFINCSFHNNGRYGYTGSNLFEVLLFRCCSYLNGSHGFFGLGRNLICFCSSHDNTNHGFDYIHAGSSLINCLSFDNQYGGTFDSVAFAYCSVFDNNGNSSIDRNIRLFGAALLFGCRVTNGYWGADFNSKASIQGWNYFEDNSEGNILEDSHLIPLLLNGQSTYLEDQNNVNEGYVSKVDGSENYNLRIDATLRNVAVPIPLI